ncbi:phage head closure protein [Neisseria elongata]|uniref:phage head closure protein n=1 Tax=Neisseria elongata TaxID=495 RepID=UPI001EF51D15|nr:phage head closure protein [Neisseria elongata]MBM7064826.1 phage head closure protein [Neisseria elongata]
MKAGQLRHRVEILQRVKEKDKSGATVMVWRPLCKVWADVRHISGSETMKHDVLSASVRASVRIRWREDITPDMRVKIGGKPYAIRAVIPDAAKRVFVDLVCESLPNESNG